MFRSTRIRWTYECSYLMTDCSPKIVSWWEKNPYLEPYFKDGLLEVSVFDIETDRTV